MGRPISEKTTLKDLEKKLKIKLPFVHESGRKVRNDKQIITIRKEQAKKK